MEIVGTVSAVVALACTVGKASKAVAKFIRTVRLADRDASLAQRELATLSLLLVQFDQLVFPPDSQAAQLNKQSGLQHPIINQGEHLIGEMERVLEKIGITDKSGLKMGRQPWLSKFRWYIRKKEVLQLCVQFNQVKMSIMAFVSMVGLESVRKELKDVLGELRKLSHKQSRGKIAQLEQDRERLEQCVAALKVEVEAAEKACEIAASEVQQQSLSPQARKLSEELDRSVHRVSKIIVKSNRRRRRRRSISRRTRKRPPSPRVYSADNSGNDSKESAESLTELPHGQGRYVNIENPQDRRWKRPPRGLLEG